MEFIYIKKSRVKQSYERSLPVVLQLRQRRSYVACAIARLTVMLARAIFRSYWGLYTCTCDRTCLRGWFEFHKVDLVLFVGKEGTGNKETSLNLLTYYRFLPLLSYFLLKNG